MHKTHMIDKVPWYLAALIAIGYLLSFIICVAVGGGGPSPGARLPGSSMYNIACDDPATCNIAVNATFGDLTGYNQALWVMASIVRPIDPITNKPMLLNQRVTWAQEFTLSAWGMSSSTRNDNFAAMTVLAKDVTHAAQMVCEIGQTTCGIAFVFGQDFVKHNKYRLHTVFTRPLQAFVEAGMSFGANTTVGVILGGGTINADFTHFQLASKYVFLAFTIIVTSVYIYFCIRGAGAVDPRTGKRLPFSSDQKWVMVLAFWLFWYNDPFFALNVTNPTFEASGFYAFNAVTCIAILLLYWLVVFDSSRSASGTATGSAAGGSSASLAKRFHCSAVTAALFFWIPKLLWVGISWMVVLTYYMVQRAAYLEDPAYNLFEQFPLIADYFTTFVGAWGALYVIYLLVLFFRSCANCRDMAPSGRYVIAVTVISLIAVLVGYFLNGVLTVNANNSSALFMTAYGSTNCYIWFLMIAYLPAKPATEEDLRTPAAAGNSQADSSYGGVPEHRTLVDTVEIGIQYDPADFEGVEEYSGPRGGGTGAVSTKHVHLTTAEAVPDSAEETTAAATEWD